MRRTCFRFRFTISDYQCSMFEFLLFNVRASSLDVRYSTFEFRCPMRKETRHRKLFDFVRFLLSVYLHYTCSNWFTCITLLVRFYPFPLLVLLRLLHIYRYSTSILLLAASTFLFYFYIASCDDKSSCPHCSSTSILLLVTTVPPARAW